MAAAMQSRSEKGGGAFAGIKLLLCENPLPPIDAAIAAARAEVPRSNYYTEAHSAPLRRLIAARLGVAERHVHINAGSELILRQIFDRFGQQVHLLTPTYALFPEIARNWTETRLLPERDFAFDLAQLAIPEGTTLAVIVNPNNPNGGTFDMAPLPRLLARHPRTRFLVDEAFIGLAGQSVATLVVEHSNLLVTRTLSKAHSLAGFRVGYAVLPETTADDLNAHNDAYPLARPSEAAAIATLEHEDEILERARTLRTWAARLAEELRGMGVRTYPTETYFFLADFAPRDAATLARALAGRGILVKALGDARLGPGYMRITTALPHDNARFVAALRELLAAPSAPPSLPTEAMAMNLEQALLDPAAVFASPEEVAAYAGFTRAQKIEILRLWEYDASEAEVATEEGMPGGDGELLRRILLALDALIGELDVGASAPTKQHAVLARRARRT